MPYGEISGAGQELLRKLHQTIAKITHDFNGRWHFNTSISSIMILVNEITAKEAAMDAGEIPSTVIADMFRGSDAVAGSVCAVFRGGDVGADWRRGCDISHSVASG